MQRNVKMHIIEAKKRVESFNDFMAIKRFNKDGENKNEWRIINSPYVFCRF